MTDVLTLAALKPPTQAQLEAGGLGAALASSRFARLSKLKRALARASAFNPEDADIATGVTLAVSSTSDAALTKLYTVASHSSLMRFSGGKPTLNGSTSQMGFPVSSTAPELAGNLGTAFGGTGELQAWGWEASIKTDADKVQIAVNGYTNPLYAFRVIVDGRYISKTPTLFTVNGGVNYIVLDFASVRKSRVIQLQAAAQVTLREIRVGPTSSIRHPGEPADAIVLLGAGDSYNEGQGATNLVRAFLKTFGRKIGATDVRQVAVGGTGYINPGPRSKSLDQIPRWLAVNSDLSAANIDIISLFTSYNDYLAISGTTYTPVQIAAEARLNWQAIRTLCPNALISIGGTHAGSRGPDTRTLDIETAIRAEFSSWQDPFSFFVPISLSVDGNTPWIFGNGKVGATNGSGNSDLAISADGVHTSDFGHDLYSDNDVSAYRTGLNRLAS